VAHFENHLIMWIALFLACVLMAAQVWAVTGFTVVIKDHLFQPEELTVPAGEEIKLLIDNQDATPEEFESHDLQLEKIIPGGSSATLRVGPLEAGTYSFFGEFNEDTAKGRIVVK
jgi:plastocyanin